MARITIERASGYNKFELVKLASHRAYTLAFGGNPLVNADNKYAVLALREIEQGKIDCEQIKESIMQKYSFENKTPIALNSLVSADFAFDDLFESENNDSSTESSAEKEDKKEKKSSKKDAKGISLETSSFFASEEVDE